MSEFQNYNGPIIDVWANCWDNNFFKQYPKLRELYQRLGIKGRMELSPENLVQEAKKQK